MYNGTSSSTYTMHGFSSNAAVYPMHGYLFPRPLVWGVPFGTPQPARHGRAVFRPERVLDRAVRPTSTWTELPKQEVARREVALRAWTGVRSRAPVRAGGPHPCEAPWNAWSGVAPCGTS